MEFENLQNLPFFGQNKAIFTLYSNGHIFSQVNNLCSHGNSFSHSNFCSNGRVMVNGHDNCSVLLRVIASDHNKL